MPTPITTPQTPDAWSPDRYGFAAEDAIPDALVLTTSSVLGTLEGDEPAIRLPYVAADPEPGFVDEGEEIPEAVPDLAEAVVVTRKVATLGRYSREQLAQPRAAEMILRSMRRGVIASADTAYLSNTDGPLVGLLHTPGMNDAGELGTDLDALAAAVAAVEDAGGRAAAIVASPVAWATLATLKTAEGSNQALLGAGTEAGVRRILGVDVRTSSAMPDDQLLVIDRDAIVSAAGEVYLDRSEHAYFGRDSVGVRATFRFGWSVMRPDRIAKVTIG